MWDKNRLTATERNGLMELNAAAYLMRLGEDRISRRIRDVKGGTRLLHAARAMLERVCRDVFVGLSDDQKPAVQRCLENTEVRYGVAKVYGKYYDEFGTWISWNQLATMMDALRDHCAVCMDENRACALRKVLDALPNDAEEKTGSRVGCPYAKI